MTTTSATTARVERIAMGVTCVATVVGIDSIDLAVRCLDLVKEFESLWSRFIPTSDISRLNNANGQPTLVDEKTLTLLHHMIAAHLSMTEEQNSQQTQLSFHNSQVFTFFTMEKCHFLVA
jgi:thiamine biosynthesis lipoprotein ApbE